ncbi:MAG: hypothetical protein HYY13_01710 [Nitrospirae bacterium]|nr:hypothetical protein [Nitrospirota bacterium]
MGAHCEARWSKSGRVVVRGLAAVAALAVVACDAGSDAEKRLQFGVNSSIEWWAGRLDEGRWTLRSFEADVLGETGGLVRMSFPWSRMEVSPGEYDFDWYDRSLDLLAAKGVVPLGVLIGSVPWNRSARTLDISGHGFYPPDDVAEFGAFVARVAARYRGRVAVWEIWNEPNVIYFWSSGPDPQLYARVLSEAVRAIRASDPGALVVSGAPAPAPNVPGLSISATDFLDRVFEAEPELVSMLDGIGIHLYGDYPPVAPPEDRKVDYRGRVREIREVLDRHGASDLPLYATEYGFCSFSGLDQETQADYLSRATLLLAAEGVDVLVPWVLLEHGVDFETFASLETFECERYFGMFGGTDPVRSPPATPKPASEAWKELVGVLDGTVYVADRTVETGVPDVSAFEFSRRGDRIVAIYRPNATVQPFRVPAAWIKGREAILKARGADGVRLPGGDEPPVIEVGPRPVFLLVR